MFLEDSSIVGPVDISFAGIYCGELQVVQDNEQMRSCTAFSSIRWLY